MKKYIGIIIITLFAVLHVVNGIGLINHSILYACIWFLFAIIESLIAMYSFIMIKKQRKWGIVLSVIVSVWLTIQAILSIVILCNSISFNTAKADKVFVLGYQLEDNRMSDTLIYRLDKANEYAMKNPDSVIIVSGGITGKNTVSEASLMKIQLMSYGINEHRIITEENSKDTIENIKYCKELVSNGDDVVIISSQYHCARIKLIAKEQGLSVKTIGAKCPLNLLMNQLMIEKFAMIGILLF